MLESKPDGRRRIKIGLLVSHLEEDFDDSVCEGAMLAAEQADANLVIFPGRYIDGVYADKLRTEYEYQYNTLFQMACDNKFDVLLILIGTIGSHLDKDKKKKFLDKFKVPVITITAKVGDYPCITIDNKTGMQQVIRHLIDVHGCRRIGFMSGPKTSEDAIERLDVYKETIAEYGIEYDENRVEYGNFSKYVGDKVDALLDRCPDLEAIVFANDQMALAGYAAMEARGIRPGKDIYVTGFDNDPVAEELTPHLTTVKADPSVLGYNAVIEAVNYVNNGTMEKDNIPSSMICRNSCGCTGNPRLKTLSFRNIADDPVRFAHETSDFLMDKYKSSDAAKRLRDEFAGFIMKINEYCTKGSATDSSLREEILERADSLANGELFKFIVMDNLYAVVEFVHQFYSSRLEEFDELMAMNQLFIQIYKIIAERNAAFCKDKLDDNHFLTWQTNSITRDMLVFEAYDDRAYQTVVDKLTRLHMNSSYLFSYEPAIINDKDEEWKTPEYVKLKAYHNGAEAIQLPPDKQNIRGDKLFDNPYLPSDRRYSLVVSPLFSNEEHYGILLCEMEHEYFHYIQSVTVQLCAALKIITLMKQQAKIRRQLQQSLIEIKENNQILSDLSKQDELTGCYNRRGFFEEVRKVLRRKAEEDYGSGAIMVFADLDSLKTINDCYGHEEGDFAIRSSAEILKSAFGSDEILGRIGGDEFVVCAFLSEQLSIPQLRAHIEELSVEYNREHAADKPYIVHISVGVYPFSCTDSVEIGELLSHADTLLYEQKKLKKPIIKAERPDWI